MKVFFILSSFIVSSLPDSPKSVNLQLITSFQIDPNDVRNNATHIQNMRSFVNELQQILSPSAGYFRTGDKIIEIGGRPSQSLILSEFVENLRRILLSYNDAELKSIAEALCKVIQDYHVRQSDFHKIFSDLNVKYFIMNVVKEWSETNVTVLRRKIKGNDETIRGFVRKLNNFYNTEDEDKLKKILKKFKKYPKKRKNLYETMEQTLQFLIFDQYNKLNETSKYMLGSDLIELARHLKNKYVNTRNDLKTVKRSSKKDDRKTTVKSAKGNLDKKRFIHTTDNVDSNENSGTTQIINTDFDISDWLDAKHKVDRNDSQNEKYSKTKQILNKKVSSDSKDSIDVSDWLDAKHTVDTNNSQNEKYSKTKQILNKKVSSDSKDSIDVSDWLDAKHRVDTDNSRSEKDSKTKQILNTEDSADTSVDGNDSLEAKHEIDTNYSRNEKDIKTKQIINRNERTEETKDSLSDSNEKEMNNKTVYNNDLITLRDLELIMKSALQKHLNI